MQESIEEYLKRLEHYGYTEEERETVKEFRENAEHMPFDQYQFLVDQKLILRPKDVYHSIPYAFQILLFLPRD